MRNKPGDVLTYAELAKALMIDFHRRLTARRPGSRAKEAKAEALRQASLNLMRNERYRHPFYRAGFVMVG